MTFLEYVAEDILRKQGTDLSRTAIVFPNKRASLFMNEYLARMAGQPLWSPTYMTISDLFRSQSELVVADDIKLVCDLYRCFTKHVEDSETLDHFYGWGQLMLADFDDLDKNMADASKVFDNVSDIHELDDLSYLTDSQKAVLKRFFSNFADDQDTRLKKKFLNLWCHFGDIYNNYKDMLRAQGIAYEGMLYREVAQKPILDCSLDRYIFVGFNLLQTAEQMLFERLRDEGKAMFYWDFDNYYMKAAHPHSPSNEAGHFIAQYLSRFPNELDAHDDDIYNRMERKKDICFVSAPTEDIQARYVTQWLNADRIADGRATAIIMCDENLLPTVVHCMPPSVDKVNITTGYPLQNTLAASFVNQLLSYRVFGGKRLYNRLMSHPYAQLADIKDTTDDRDIDNRSRQLLQLRSLGNAMKTIARKQDTPFGQESLFRMYTITNRLANLVETGNLDVDMITLHKLLQQIIRSTSIPYHGEPAEGIQLMGVLETRNLDFKHLLILSCNEGNMPKDVNDASFVPYSIRKTYGMTTITNKVAVYAYYFYRMLQRANDVTVVYNNSTEEGHTGEMSRFMLQMIVESGHDINRKMLVADKQQSMITPKAVEKDMEVMRALEELATKGFYPTYMSRYLRCQLMFYFNYIVGLKEPDAIEEDQIDNRSFGNIFHRAAQLIYEEHEKSGKPVTASHLEYFLNHPDIIERAVDKALLEEKPQLASSDVKLTGLQIINREVIIRYLKRLLALDKQAAPFRVVGLEQPVEEHMLIKVGEKDVTVRVGGIVDRIDITEDKTTHERRLRVIDYKTGNRALEVRMNSIDEIFAQPFVPKKHADYYLQTFLYASMVSRDDNLNSEKMPVAPALLFIQHATGKDYDPTLTVGKEAIRDIAEKENVFRNLLYDLLREIFDPDKPFLPTDDRSLCTLCPYRQICG